ncbi:hypothetical protein E9993_12455 [Labilibacter sediminis]|nr:hypothetical protein E9993_12455 [Labilibacter sediminis]
MKNFNQPILIITLLAIITCSCSSYQFVTLKSSLQQPSSDGFIFDNDTLFVEYSFNGPNCPVILNIHNKTNVPVYLNWNHSSVIINGESFPLNPSTSEVSSEYSEISTEFLDDTYTHGVGNATIYHDNRIEFLPPKSKISVNNITICSDFFTGEGAHFKHSVKKKNPGNTTYKVTEYTFNEETSPMEIRCFLSYSTKPKENWQYLDHMFWVSSFYNCTNCSLPTESNRFYLTKSTGAGTALGAVAVIGIIAVAAQNSDSGEDSSY